MFKVGFQRLFNIYNYFEGVNIEYEISLNNILTANGLIVRVAKQ